MKFSEIEKKNLNFYAPRFQILVGGTDILYEGVEIVSVTINDKLEGPDDFSITINNPELKWLEAPLFALGKEVEIKMGYAGELTPIIVGDISALEPNFSSSGPQQMGIRGFDLLKRLQRGERFRSWDEYKDSEIATKIADEHHLLPGGIEKTDIEHPKIMQNGETDFSFLKKRAQDIGFEMFVRLRTFHFQKPKKNKDPITTLILGKTLTTFSPQLNLANKPSRVTVRGWNPREKKEIVGIAEKGQEDDPKKKGQSASQVIEKLYGPVKASIREPVYSKEQAEKRAMAILNAASDQFIKGNGTCVGIPEIQAGRYIKIEGLGRLFSMKYYIETATHKIDTSGYTTTFSVKGNAI